jgi:PAS domain S-box-containing protein
MEGRITALRDESGKVTGYVAAYRDITERKRAEDDLRRSESNLADAQKLSHTGSWSWNVATGELRWSLEHFHIFGLDPETFRPDQENTQRMIHPHDMLRVEQTLAKAIHERSDFEVYYRLIRPDGSIRYHYGLGHPVVNQLGDLEFIGSVVDLSERKQAEERLRRSESYLVEGQRLSHTGSWAWNVSTGELFWSLEHFRMCGVDPDTFMPTLENARRLIHPQDLLASTQAFEKATAEKREFDQELRIVCPDGTVRYVHSLAHPVLNESGDVTEYVGTMMDVTERRKIDEERAGLLRQIVQAQEDERRRIALEMHDQFGQQLSALVLKLSALRRERGRRKVLGQQLASLEAMTRQLDSDLELIVSRLRPPALDDLGLVAALTNYLKRWSQHFEIQADIHASGAQPDRLSSEIDTALYRVMQEALNNVAKHARAGHVAILLDWRPDRVSLIVEDDGIGFDVQQPVGSRQRFGVVGMRDRATLLGGTLDIESQPGKGTTVVARIPMASNPERQPA